MWPSGIIAARPGTPARRAHTSSSLELVVDPRHKKEMPADFYSNIDRKKSRSTTSSFIHLLQPEEQPRRAEEQEAYEESQWTDVDADTVIGDDATTTTFEEESSRTHFLQSRLRDENEEEHQHVNGHRSAAAAASFFQSGPASVSGEEAAATAASDNKSGETSAGTRTSGWRDVFTRKYWRRQKRGTPAEAAHFLELIRVLRKAICEHEKPYGRLGPPGDQPEALEAIAEKRFPTLQLILNTEVHFSVGVADLFLYARGWAVPWHWQVFGGNGADGARRAKSEESTLFSEVLN
ncbi:unnamed protein product, partial [Amoebophrya sp. A120]|eukprot:GSA120T00026436001.1